MTKEITTGVPPVARPAVPPRAKAGTCLRLARMLGADLRALDWEAMDAADREGLRRALTDLGGEIPLVWLIRGQGSSRREKAESEDTADSRDAADTGDTAKAAPAASPSREGIESSDGDAAFPGHPPPASQGYHPRKAGRCARRS